MRTGLFPSRILAVDHRARECVRRRERKERRPQRLPIQGTHLSLARALRTRVAHYSALIRQSFLGRGIMMGLSPRGPITRTLLRLKCILRRWARKIGLMRMILQDHLNRQPRGPPLAGMYLSRVPDMPCGGRHAPANAIWNGRRWKDGHGARGPWARQGGKLCPAVVVLVLLY
jgi:hypothetical protein